MTDRRDGTDAAPDATATGGGDAPDGVDPAVGGDPAPGGDPADATDAIDLLAHETRVAILRELAEHKRVAPGNPELSFTELRQRVGAVDSGKFNYHLQKLCGRFVREADTGYELGYAGRAVIDAARGSVHTDGTGGDADGSGAGGDGTGEVCEVCGEPDCNRRIHIHLGGR